MWTYPNGGCYGECYAYRTAARYGMDFSTSVSRKILGQWHRSTLCILMGQHRVSWYRIGTAGDPCHDWDNTLVACRAFHPMQKTPVIITKHWIPLTDEHIRDLRWAGAVVNTSVSALDTDDELRHRLEQRQRLAEAGVGSVLRVVTCAFGSSEWARAHREKQDWLLSLVPVIDNPLRPSTTNPRVLTGDLLTTHRKDAIGGGKLLSLHSPHVYLGKCEACPDQCGVKEREGMVSNQMELFTDKVEYKYVQTVIGSGYEQDVAALALEDGIAHRAARKNMQIHSAIILLLNDEFSGFFTFQDNHEVKEFCLLQSVIRPDRFSSELYRRMALAVLEQNTNQYPALITTDPRSKFETPKFFESVGFQTYLKMSGFHYMVRGNLEDVRMKILAHITMTNCWRSTGADWLRLKAEWNKRITDAGEREGVANPTFATREGCWQGENGFANVVTGHSHNGNASVLDPVACEIVLRFFMPTEGRRVYNPFGGGVQFGFITGAYGYEYVASEIRLNQCEANNKLCSEFPGVRWVQSDSSTYEPDGTFDLVFACPPYYRVERYVDYDGNPPEGEINNLDTYEQFRDTLFAGYAKAIEHLNDDRFFVIMTGDSRGNKGAYHCSEAETELFLRDAGLSVYNKIVYLESEFTRLAHAKKTLNQRKFPKAEQKIIVAYKGKTDRIKELYPPVGRL